MRLDPRGGWGGGGWSTRPCNTEIGRARQGKHRTWERDYERKSSSPDPPNFRVSAPRAKFDIGIETEVKAEAMAMYMVRTMERDAGFDEGSGSRHQTPARNGRDLLISVVLAKSGH